MRIAKIVKKMNVDEPDNHFPIPITMLEDMEDGKDLMCGKGHYIESKVVDGHIVDEDHCLCGKIKLRKNIK